MSVCAKQPVLHLNACIREAGHDGPCWPWTQLEAAGVWHVAIVNDAGDGTAGPLALKVEASEPTTTEKLHKYVVNLPGYPTHGLPY